MKNICMAMQPSAETPFFPDDSSAVIRHLHPAPGAHLPVSVDLMVLGPPVGRIPWYLAFCGWLILNEHCVLEALFADVMANLGCNLTASRINQDPSS